MEIKSTELAVLCVFGLLMLSACEKSEERDKLVGATYEVQTYIGSKPWQKCMLRFEAAGKAYWDESGKNSEWNYDLSDTEIMLARADGGRRMNLVIRQEGLYGNPCGGNLKKVE